MSPYESALLPVLVVWCALLAWHQIMVRMTREEVAAARSGSASGKTRMYEALAVGSAFPVLYLTDRFGALRVFRGGSGIPTLVLFVEPSCAMCVSVGDWLEGELAKAETTYGPVRGLVIAKGGARGAQVMGTVFGSRVTVWGDESGDGFAACGVRVLPMAFVLDALGRVGARGRPRRPGDALALFETLVARGLA